MSKNTTTAAPAAPEPAKPGKTEPRFKLGDKILTRAQYDAEFKKIQAAAVAPPPPPVPVTPAD